MHNVVITVIVKAHNVMSQSVVTTHYLQPSSIM